MRRPNPPSFTRAHPMNTRLMFVRPINTRPKPRRRTYETAFRHLTVIIPCILMIGLLWIIEVSLSNTSGLVVLAHSQ